MSLWQHKLLKKLFRFSSVNIFLGFFALLLSLSSIQVILIADSFLNYCDLAANPIPGECEHNIVRTPASTAPAPKVVTPVPTQTSRFAKAQAVSSASVLTIDEFGTPPASQQATPAPVASQTPPASKAPEPTKPEEKPVVPVPVSAAPTQVSQATTSTNTVVQAQTSESPSQASSVTSSEASQSSSSTSSQVMVLKVQENEQNNFNFLNWITSGKFLESIRPSEAAGWLSLTNYFIIIIFLILLFLLFAIVSTLRKRKKDKEIEPKVNSFVDQAYFDRMKKKLEEKGQRYSSIKQQAQALEYGSKVLLTIYFCYLKWGMLEDDETNFTDPNNQNYVRL